MTPQFSFVNEYSLSFEADFGGKAVRFVAALLVRRSCSRGWVYKWWRKRAETLRAGGRGWQESRAERERRGEGREKWRRETWICCVVVPYTPCSATLTPKCQRWHHKHLFVDIIHSHCGSSYIFIVSFTERMKYKKECLVSLSNWELMRPNFMKNKYFASNNKASAVPKSVFFVNFPPVLHWRNRNRIKISLCPSGSSLHQLFHLILT